jgi:L-cystine transport system substrate-binding protein
MKKSLKIASIALASLLAAGLFAGCGGDQKAASAKTAAAADGKTSVKLVLSSTERPLSWADENGKVQGYEYDIWQEVNKNLKDYHLDIQAVPPETQDVMMESGDAKVASGGYYRTPRREQDYIVPKTPIGVSSVMVYMSKENAQKYHSLEDVIRGGGKLVPNTPNGGIYKVLTDWNKAHDNIMKEVPIQDGLTPAERLTSLKNGQYDALVYPNNLGVEDIAKAMNFDIVALDKPIKVNETVVIVNKNEQKLADEIEAALEKLSKDGTLQKISEKWYHRNLFDQLKEAQAEAGK